MSPGTSTKRTRSTQRIEDALQTLQKTVDGLNDSQLYQNCQSLRQNLNFSQSAYPLERVIDYKQWDPMIRDQITDLTLKTYSSNMFDRLRTSCVPKIQSLTSKGIPIDVYTQYMTQYKIDVKNRSMNYLPSQIVGDSSSFMGKKFRKITGLSPQAECTSAGVTNLTSSSPNVPFKVNLQPDIKFVERFSPLYKYGDPVEICVMVLICMCMGQLYEMITAPTIYSTRGVEPMPMGLQTMASVSRFESVN